jgi:exodeoxyribonuclease-1
MTYYWHDYETWGANPATDRAAQFAGLRTDAELNPIGEPLVLYARPAQDVLPQPQACLTTGITPQRALAEGLPEADFFAAIHAELSQPGTCALGYNSLRFDDEVTRYGLYRNFFDPYEREWKRGNSRWDLIDVVRLTRALRPEGLEWPVHPDGTTSFRLTDLTAANNISHTDAHDALADVQATIALARLLRQQQPRLFEYCRTHHDKTTLSALLDPQAAEPVLHVSARYPAATGCIALVLPLAWHPTQKNGVIVYDLRQDPTDVLQLSAAEIHARLYTATADLPDGQVRPALKVVHLNRAPVVVPASTLTDNARADWHMPAAPAAEHAAALQAAQPALASKLADVFSIPYPARDTDPDFDLYGGGFLSPPDRALCREIQRATPTELACLRPDFIDPRLTTLLFRYRARNWPETLNAQEHAAWETFRQQRLTDPTAGASITLADYQTELSQLIVDTTLSTHQRDLLEALLAWPTQLGLSSHL